MASSFTVAGTAYDMIVLADGVPRSTAADVSVRHIPGGGITYVDLGGPSLLSLDLSVLFLTGTDALTFEGLEGKAGTLVTADAPGGEAAILMSVHRASRGVNTNGPTTLSCTFLLVPP